MAPTSTHRMLEVTVLSMDLAALVNPLWLICYWPMVDEKLSKSKNLINHPIIEVCFPISNHKFCCWTWRSIFEILNCFQMLTRICRTSLDIFHYMSPSCTSKTVAFRLWCTLDIRNVKILFICTTRKPEITHCTWLRSKTNKLQLSINNIRIRNQFLFFFDFVFDFPENKKHDPGWLTLVRPSRY